jgi:ABC-2 type transport system ATP-binding protein
VRAQPGLRLEHHDLKVTETSPGEYVIAGALDTTAIADVLGWFAAKDAHVTAVNTRRRTLEDVYLALTMQGARR